MPLSSTKRGRLTVTALMLASILGGVPAISAASLPPHFQANAKSEAGPGLTCVAGSSTDADGMNARAFVVIEDTKSHKIRWATAVPLEKGWYQNQATHCLSDGGHVLAIIQSDTTSESTLAQTFVDVATFDTGTGRLTSTSPVKVPDVHGAVSAFVDSESSNFKLIDGKPVVTGQYFLLSNRDDMKPFTASPAATSKANTEGK
jgi:hypothetical protein